MESGSILSALLSLPCEGAISVIQKSSVDTEEWKRFCRCMVGGISSDTADQCSTITRGISNSLKELTPARCVSVLRFEFTSWFSRTSCI